MSVTSHPKVTTFPEPEPGGFAFTQANWEQAQTELAKYPEDHKASAVLALLWLAQKQLGNHLTNEAIEYVAGILDMAPIRVHEVAHFYSMFNLKPVGEYFVQVCRTTPCWLVGADDLAETVRAKLGTAEGEVTEDGKFSWRYVECLGACCNAPMVQINDWYYEDLTPEILARLLDDLRAGREVAIGSQQGRHGSEPAGGPNTLTEVGETGHPEYPFGGGADVEPVAVRQAREAAESADNTGGGQ
jgi:NADH-quinone oxidoreductase subunit E